MSYTLAGLALLAIAAAAAVQPVRAQAPSPEPTPQVIDLASMTDEQVGPVVPNLGTLRTKTLVSLPSGVVSVQVGDPPKHSHQQSVEIQYVISGEGTLWLGGEEVHVHEGDLIVIPKGTAHGGSHSTRGHLKLLAIKLPPPVAGDFQKLP
jgi:quercetin dioxygenase-like cupin family protein